MTFFEFWNNNPIVGTVTILICFIFMCLLVSDCWEELLRRLVQWKHGYEKACDCCDNTSEQEKDEIS